LASLAFASVEIGILLSTLGIERKLDLAGYTAATVAFPFATAVHDGIVLWGPGRVVVPLATATLPLLCQLLYRSLHTEARLAESILVGALFALWMALSIILGPPSQGLSVLLAGRHPGLDLVLATTLGRVAANGLYLLFWVTLVSPIAAWLILRLFRRRTNKMEPLTAPET
jgi:hypothetical protein